MSNIFIGTPAYQEPCAGYYASIISTIPKLERAGHIVKWQLWEKCCYVHTARNKLCAEFLFSGFDELLFIDCDLAWKDDDLVRLCGVREDIIGAAAPFRFGPHGFPTHPKTKELDSRGLLEVITLPTAIMKVSRAAFMGIASAGMSPLTIEYNNAGEEKGRYLSYFDFERDNENHVEYGEDVTFCRKALRCDLKLWVDPDCDVTHFGPDWRRGNLKEHLFGAIAPVVAEKAAA